MLQTAAGQAQAFLAAVYGGVALGLCYDVLRAWRVAMRAGRGMTGVLDAVFSLCALGIVGGVLWLAVGGEVRAYVLAGFPVGAALYAAALSRFIMKVFKKLFGLIREGFIRIASLPLIKRMFR